MSRGFMHNDASLYIGYNKCSTAVSSKVPLLVLLVDESVHGLVGHVLHGQPTAEHADARIVRFFRLQGHGGLHQLSPTALLGRPLTKVKIRKARLDELFVQGLGRLEGLAVCP